MVERLAAYITAADLAAREAEIRGLVAQGAQDVHAIMTSRWSADEVRRLAARETHPATRDRQVTGIMWYLTALAVERNQGFVRGAFVCRDPHGRLSAYFRGVGTPRISSHLKRHSAPGCTGGVDLRADDSLPPLAYGHRHVLFVTINHDKRRGNCLFLKPELYGVTGVLNFFHHAVLYMRSLVRRRRFGGNDGVGMRKERIPDHFVRDFRKAVAHLSDGPSAIAEVGCRGEGDGIGCMHDYLVMKLADANLPESTRMPLATILYRLKSEYDFVAMRFGSEVFLDLATDLAGPLPKAPGVHGPSPSLQWLGQSNPNDPFDRISSHITRSSVVSGSTTQMPGEMSSNLTIMPSPDRSSRTQNSPHCFSSPLHPPSQQAAGPKRRHTLEVPRLAPTRSSRDGIDTAVTSGRLSSTAAATPSGIYRALLSLMRRNTRSMNSERKRMELEDDDRVLVGTRMDERRADWVIAYNMLTGIRVSVLRTNAMLDRPLADADFEAKQNSTLDMRTLHHAEHKFLRKILKDYYEHVMDNPNTLLSQFYGLHRVKLPYGKKIYFVVMNNLFPPHRDIHQTFDLKGSTVGRDCKEKDLAKNPRATLKDLNWFQRHQHLEFGVEKERLFLEQLYRDVRLLQRLQIMDYSLLIGIHDLRRGNKGNLRDKTLQVFKPGGGNTPEDFYPYSALMRMPSQLKNQRKAKELRQMIMSERPVVIGRSQRKMSDYLEEGQSKDSVFCKDDGGIRATRGDNIPGDEIYYLGIIDCLTQNTVLKNSRANASLYDLLAEQYQ
ncbi:hypothetical protein DL768_009460 [Monosporascus sp. mg162]|nr:hypothetical protein DL768_009460 [Monosporascus sp. mg162]